MVRIQDIAAAIERIAPLHFQDDFDNSGLQVGFPSSETGRVLVCLDVTEDVVKEAADKGCGLIVSHHPLLFRAHTPGHRNLFGAYQPRQRPRRR